jgi:hypothetical protein
MESVAACTVSLRVSIWVVRHYWYEVRKLLRRPAGVWTRWELAGPKATNVAVTQASTEKCGAHQCVDVHMGQAGRHKDRDGRAFAPMNGS